MGAPVRLMAIAPAAGAPLTYRWDWEGRGSYATTSDGPAAMHVFKRAGQVLVGVLVLDARGERAIARGRIVVEAARPNRAGARPHRQMRRGAAAPAAHAAADPTVAIKDFRFAAAALTIHAGETVTWVNEGPSSHTATGQGGFDTGVLRAGQSASHQFTSPGTFSYFCSIHPNMRASVVVLASAEAKSTPERPSASGESAKSGPAEEVPRGPHLPNTGMNLLLESLVGLGLLLLGTVLLAVGRRRAPTSRPANRRESRAGS